MKELNDHDFDKVFKTRITEEFLEFEEESWSKMEQKLRKKDRFIFYRNASIILLFLSFGLGFYFVNKQDENKAVENFADTKKQGKPGKTERVNAPVSPATKVSTAQLIAEKGTDLQVDQNSLFKKTKAQQPQNVVKAKNQPTVYAIVSQKQPQKDSISSTYDINVQTGLTVAAVEDVRKNAPESAPKIEMPKIDELITSSNADAITTDSIKKKPIIAKVKRKIPISLAISAGPDFNATNTLIGGKTSVAFGFSVGVGLTKKLTLQTGLGFGLKNYNTTGSDYTFAVTNPSNPYGPGTAAFQSTIASINAACKVLEVPFVASYLFTDNQKRSISFNAGLSSYFMLKEQYIYKYTAASGKNDRTNEYTNANQHILSVINLSATYNFKLKNKNLGFGIEPYVKIPLTGIGEGSVPLKSSGIALKLQYDFNRR